MIRAFQRLFLVLLGAFLGSACNPKMEYGVPGATYRVDGVVRAADGDKPPIAGIKLSMGEAYGSFFDGVTGVFATTDAQGRFSFEKNLFPCGNSCQLKVRDVDGEDNGGKFKDKDVQLSLKQTAKGNGNWDEGTFEQKDVEVLLERDSTGE